MTDFCPYCGAARHDVLRFEGLTLDTARRAITIHGEPAPRIRETESRLLGVLMRRPGMVYSNDQLLEACSSHGQPNVIKVFMHHLRRKIAGSGARIATHHCLGYSLEAEERPAPAQRVTARAAAMALTVALGLLMAAPAAAHDWYGQLRSPSGMLCCNQRDCHPVDWRAGESSWGEVEVNGEWFPVEFDKIVRAVGSPDGNWHACWTMRRAPDSGPGGPSVPYFRCFIGPSGS